MASVAHGLLLARIPRLGSGRHTHQRHTCGSVLARLRLGGLRARGVARRAHVASVAHSLLLARIPARVVRVALDERELGQVPRLADRVGCVVLRLHAVRLPLRARGVPVAAPRLGRANGEFDLDHLVVREVAHGDGLARVVVERQAAYLGLHRLALLRPHARIFPRDHANILGACRQLAGKAPRELERGGVAGVVRAHQCVRRAHDRLSFLSEAHPQPILLELAFVIRTLALQPVLGDGVASDLGGLGHLSLELLALCRRLALKRLTRLAHQLLVHHVAHNDHGISR